MLISLLLIFLLNIQLAYYDSQLIRNGIKINHILNALLYCCLVVVEGLHYNNGWMFLSMLLMRNVVFDISLNLFNKKKWNDISSETSSIIDKIEREIFGFDGTTQYISESILLILLIGIGMM